MIKNPSVSHKSNRAQLVIYYNSERKIYWLCVKTNGSVLKKVMFNFPFLKITCINLAKYFTVILTISSHYNIFMVMNLVYCEIVHFISSSVLFSRSNGIILGRKCLYKIELNTLFVFVCIFLTSTESAFVFCVQIVVWSGNDVMMWCCLWLFLKDNMMILKLFRSLIFRAFIV